MLRCQPTQVTSWSNVYKIGNALSRGHTVLLAWIQPIKNICYYVEVCGKMLESKQVKVVTSHTIILPPMRSFLCSISTGVKRNCRDTVPQRFIFKCEIKVVETSFFLFRNRFNRCESVNHVKGSLRMYLSVWERKSEKVEECESEPIECIDR